MSSSNKPKPGEKKPPRPTAGSRKEDRRRVSPGPGELDSESTEYGATGSSPTRESRYIDTLITSLHSLSEERESKWRIEQLEREQRLRIEAEEREDRRRVEAERKALEIKLAAEQRALEFKREAEERDRMRDAQFSALINQLAQSTSDSLAFTRRVEDDKLVAVGKQTDLAAERWEKDRQDRERKAALSAIPAPQHMAKEQDVADYIDLFLANMDSREIGKKARARHLLPLLNAKATAAIAGLTPEAKDDIDVLVKTLMDTADTTPTYVSQTLWHCDKEGGDGVRAATVKVVRYAKRLGKNEGEIVDRLLAEKVTQMYHAEVQEYVREKEPKDPFEAADLVVRYFKLKGIDEHKYELKKPWTHKSKEERQKEDKSPSEHRYRGNRWSNYHPGYKQSFKGNAYDSHQVNDFSKAHDQSQDSGKAVTEKGANSSHKDQKPTVSQAPNNQHSNGTQANYRGARETRSCHYCGKVGHLMKDCYRRKNVAAAHVPSLASVASDALVVAGKIGDKQVAAMLCDSGATISVVAEHLVPEGTEKLEEVWIGTVDVEPRPYPTAIIPATVQGKELELFAAIMPAERLPHTVILGRYIPGKQVIWSMRVADEHGTVFQLSQESNNRQAKAIDSNTDLTDGSEGDNVDRDMTVDKQTKTVSVTNTGERILQHGAMEEQSSSKPKSRRKSKFAKTQSTVERTKDPEGHGAEAGETASQVVEARAVDVPLSPTGKGIWVRQEKIEKKRFSEDPLDVAVVSRESSPYMEVLKSTELPHQPSSAPISEVPNKEMHDLALSGQGAVLVVETRAQKKRKEEQERKDDEATAQSGVVLSGNQGKRIDGSLLGQQGGPAASGSQDAFEKEVPSPGSRAPAFQVTAPGTSNSSNQSPARPTQTTDSADSDSAAAEHRELRPTQEADQPMEITREELIQSQKEDAALHGFWKDGTGDAASSFKVIDGILYRRRSGEDVPVVTTADDQGMIVVPTKHRQRVLQAGHDFAGHFGIKKTKRLIEDHFFWPGMGKDIAHHCKTCKQCLKFNNKRNKREPMALVETISEPWRRVAMDIVGPFDRTTKGNKYILTLMDHGTRYMEAIPLRRIDAEATCNAMLEVFARFGVPEEVLTDNGSNFVATVTDCLLKQLKCLHVRTSPFHPQSNGTLERAHAVMKKTLDKLGCSKTNWDQFLAPTLMAMRTVPHTALGVSPFHLLFGRDARTPVSALRESMTQQMKAPKKVIEYLHHLYETMEQSQQLVEREDTLAKEQSKKFYDRDKKSDPLKVGDQVLMMTPKGEESLTCRWDGPYKIKQVLGERTYLLDAPYKGKRGRRCHRDMLKRYFVQILSNTLVLAADDEVGGQLLTTRDIVGDGEDPPETKWEKIQMDPELTSKQREEMTMLLKEFDEVFKNTPGKADVTPFRIPTGDAQPIANYPRRLPPKWKKKIAEEIQLLESTGIVVPSTSPWSFPIHPVPKPGGEVRMCLDYRQLNEVTQPDKYPLPDISQLLDEVSSARYITHLDLTKGYYQIPVAEEDQKKTAFVAPTGKWEFQRMPFGLKGAPAAFQREIDETFRAHPHTSAYIDDVAVYSSTWEQHLIDVRNTLQKLKEKGLTVKLAKCKFARKKLEFLGHYIGEGTIRPQEAKVAALLKKERPQTKKELQSYLGSTGYYRRFISQYSTIATPLTDLTRKQLPDQLDWSDVHQEAFEELRRRLSSAPVLIAPDHNLPFILSTDASGVGIGAVLEQEREGTVRPIAYFSRKLAPRERVYPITELEALAIVDAVEHFAVYLLGAEFTVITDHRALIYLNRMNNRSVRLTRWSNALQPYHCTFKYRKGSENHVADYLSRARDSPSSDQTSTAKRGRWPPEEGGDVGPAPTSLTVDSTMQRPSL